MRKEQRDNFIQKITFLNHIKQNSVSFSNKQLKIADYIIRHYDKTAFLTAAQLATKVDASESTVIRFATALGYKGYPEFQGHLQKIIMEELTSTERLKRSIHSETKDDIFSRTFLKEADNIRETYRNIPLDDFRKVVNIILKAKKIFVSGFRTSACLVKYFVFQIGKIRENVIEITHGGKESWDVIRRGTPEDLLIVVAFPRYPREIVELTDFALQLKMHVVGITDRMTSPIAVRCKPVLLVPFELVTFVDLYSAPFTLLAALISEVAIQEERETFANLEQFEDFVKQSKIYY